MTLTDQLVDRLVSGTLTLGGQTVDVTTGAAPSTGYAVGLSGGTDIPLAEGLGEALRSFVADHADILTMPDHYLGTWLDAGRLYVDVVRVVPALEDALTLAHREGQRAIYDLAARVTVYADPLAPAATLGLR